MRAPDRAAEVATSGSGGIFDGRASKSNTGFCARLLAVIGKRFPGSRPDDGIPIRFAADILRGVPRRFIPFRSCERHRFITIRDLTMLCCCLDDAEVGAKPGEVSAAQLHLAWGAAGHINWLHRQAGKQVLEQAHLRALAENPWIIGAMLKQRSAAR